MKNLNKILMIFILLILTACGGQSNKETASANPEIRLKQYVVQGGRLYSTYCANCHQPNGEGLASLYPPLNKADYLLQNVKNAACVIKNGLKGEISVNGTTYNQMMPGNPQLSTLEVAEILTFITNSWDNKHEITNVKDVEQWLQSCKN